MIWIQLSDLSRVGVNFEISNFLNLALQDGDGITSKTFENSLNYDVFERGGSRPRFVAYFAEILSQKLRMLWLHYLPPHPAFGLSWLITLAGTSIVLMLFARVATGSWLLGCVGVFLFLTSMGASSLTVYQFRMAKPLIVFFSATYLLLLELLERAGSQKSQSLIKFLIAALILVFSFVDESFLIVVLAGVLGSKMFISEIHNKRYSWMWIFVVPVIVHIFLVLVVVPQSVPGWDYLGYILHKNHENARSPVGEISLYYFFSNILMFVGDLTFPWRPLASFWWLLVPFSFFVVHLSRIFKWSHLSTSETSRSIVSIMFAVVATSFLLQRNKVGIGIFYYGSFISIFSSLYLVRFVHSFGTSRPRLAFAICAYVVCVNIVNFETFRTTFFNPGRDSNFQAFATHPLQATGIPSDKRVLRRLWGASSYEELVFLLKDEMVDVSSLQIAKEIALRVGVKNRITADGFQNPHDRFDVFDFDRSTAWQLRFSKPSGAVSFEFKGPVELSKIELHGLRLKRPARVSLEIKDDNQVWRKISEVDLEAGDHSIVNFDPANNRLHTFRVVFDRGVESGDLKGEFLREIVPIFKEQPI